MNHFCVPLQTTSSRILKLMNRHYDINKVLKIIKEIKNENPKIEISTQFIYGFPTETFEEFKDYFRMLSVFDMLWFWYYSPRR
ncbi:MAG: radical SAM protein [Candidatus Peribacteria bacterium]|nr:radical SAM protein [Candidatus Peribacteria bacterium]